MTDSPKKRDIIEHAFNAFYDRGFSLGVDAIMADTGISKRTLYKYFPSKEELVIELLKHYRNVAIDGLRAKVEELSPDPRGRLHALFEVRKAMSDEETCRGCFAISALIEFRDGQPGIETAAHEMIANLKGFIGELCEIGGFVDPHRLAEDVLLLFQGAIVAAQVQQSLAPFDVARSILDRIAIRTSSAR
jgi:AcrR family transcriptional regulator